jgi:hypothetical protein
MKRFLTYLATIPFVISTMITAPNLATAGSAACYSRVNNTISKLFGVKGKGNFKKPVQEQLGKDFLQ